jgi:hypothetical protein
VYVPLAPGLSVIQAKLLPQLSPFVLLLHHVLDDTPHTATDLLPLSRASTPLLPLLLHLVPLPLGDLLCFASLQALQPSFDLRLLSLERLNIGNKVCGAEGRVQRRERAAEGFGIGDENGRLGAEFGGFGVGLGELLGGAGVFRLLCDSLVGVG